MKRFIQIMAIMTVAFLLSSNAYATHRSWNRSTGTQGTGYYLGLSGGLNILGSSSLDSTVSLDIDYDSGFGVGGIFGYDFGAVRLDSEITYRDNGISLIGLPAEGSTSALSYMINGYYDVPTSMLLKPYLGGGIGYATVSINDANIPGVTSVADDSASVFAYQLSAGLGFEINHTTTLSLGYRYFGTEDPKMADTSGEAFTTEYQSHEFIIGVRFLFH
jgi:opacity protein-like surface antigen